MMKAQMSDRFSETHTTIILPKVMLLSGQCLNAYWYFQAAVYGIGICAEFGGSMVKPLVGGKLRSRKACKMDI